MSNDELDVFMCGGRDGCEAEMENVWEKRNKCQEGGRQATKQTSIQQPHTVCIAPNYRHRQTPITTRRHAKYGQFTMSGGCKRKCNGSKIKTKICRNTSYKLIPFSVFFFSYADKQV